MYAVIAAFCQLQSSIIFVSVPIGKCVEFRYGAIALVMCKKNNCMMKSMTYNIWFSNSAKKNELFNYLFRRNLIFGDQLGLKKMVWFCEVLSIQRVESKV